MMALRDLLEEYKYDSDFIYEGLILDISYQLKEKKKKKGLTKKQLAEKMGVKPSYITKIFGGGNISIKTIAKVLAALEVESEIVLKEKSEKDLMEINVENNEKILNLENILEVSDEIDGIQNIAA